MASYDANALSLTDYAKMSSDPKVQGIAWSLVEHNAILADIPWISSPTLKVTGSRFETLPGNTWVKINETIPTQTASPIQHDEHLYLMRDKITTDDVFVRDINQIEDPHVARVRAYMEGRSRSFNDAFIDNDPSQGGNEDAIVGLRARLDNPATYRIKSDNKIGSGGTFTAAATAQNYLGVLEKIDDLLDAVGDLNGDSTIVYCNRQFLKRFNALTRIHSGVGGFSRGQDQYDRWVTKYKGATFVDVGYGNDQTTQIISATEPADGGYGSPATSTSLYAVNYRKFNGVMNSMRVIENPLEDGVLHSTTIEMIVGLFPRTNNCFGRLHGINLG